MVNFKIKIANKVLDINAFNETTKRYCRNFLSEEKEDYVITMNKEDLKNESSNSIDGKVYVNEEISALYRKIADLFVEEDILVFHGSSFKVNNCGFIVTARSGVGKSTHVNLLKELLGDELIYINDDKPLLEVKDDIIIFSNPWNGKESKKIVNKEEIYIKLMSQTYLPKEKSKREKVLKLVDKLLKRTNFYEINVNMDMESIKMTKERIIDYEIK